MATKISQSTLDLMNQVHRSVCKAQREFTSKPIAETRSMTEMCDRTLDLLQTQIKKGAGPEVLSKLEILRDDVDALLIRVRIAESKQRPAQLASAPAKTAVALVPAVKPKTLRDIPAPEFHTSGSVRRSIAWTVLDLLGILPAMNNRTNAKWKNGPWVELSAAGLLLDFGRNEVPERLCKNLEQALIQEEGYDSDKVTRVGNKLLIEFPHAFLFLAEKCKFEAFQIWELLEACYKDPTNLAEDLFPEKDFLEVVEIFRKLCVSGKIDREDELIREIETWEIGIAKVLRAGAEARGVAAQNLPPIPVCENATATQIANAAATASRYAGQIISQSPRVPTNGAAMIAEIEKVLNTYDIPTLEKLCGETSDQLVKMNRIEYLSLNARYDDTGAQQKELDSLQRELGDTLIYRLSTLTNCFVHTFCDGSVYKCGRDSRNRELLTDPHFTKFLSNPDLMLAILAHKVLAHKKEIHDDSNRHLTELAGMLYWGLLNQHPAVLETMPVNRTFALASKGRTRHLVEYQRRKNIQSTFLPILEAISAVHKKVVQKPCTVVQRSHLDQPYDVRKWGTDYRKMLEKILATIETIQPETLIESASGTSFDQFVLQYMGGFNTLMNKLLEKDPKQMSLDEIGEAIASSHQILDQYVAHFFYDPLHMLAALKEAVPSAPFITIKDGVHVAPRDLIMAVFKKFCGTWKGEYSIAAEQFYIRLMLIADKLKIQ